MLIQILDVLIGLSVVYLVFSTAASAAVELVEVVLRRRGALLRKGVQELLAATLPGNTDGKTLDTLVERFYNSPHIASLYSGRLSRLPLIGWWVRGGQLPSYIPPERFAAAVQWLAANPPVATEATAQPAGNPFARLAEIALSLAPDAAADAKAQQEKIAAYFTASAERYSGWYRRHVQLVLLLSGGLMAATLNLDSLRIAQVLSNDPALRGQIVEQALKDAADGELAAYEIRCADTTTPETPPPAGTDPKPAGSAGQAESGQTSSGDGGSSSDDPAAACEKKLKDGIARRIDYASTLGLPIGWDDDPLLSAPRHAHWLDWLQKFGGLLITALAICMGAPFWFDLLNQLANIRTSVKPASEDKSTPKSK
ncbi:hypothetical protein ED208_00250 [Stagnimonas aquatica]|uniref:Uncharacterized protein n=1 Tax=Stagnimonas aquatica TaxID=2689987 RepID=A0A3N0VJS7_9GAMM|nr:hypothetical protein [Stagnimonas aquatica]ROH93007.1 hypothetical protein ED208_00250 [Stagnimonas aquatica]